MFNMHWLQENMIGTHGKWLWEWNQTDKRSIQWDYVQTNGRRDTIWNDTTLSYCVWSLRNGLITASFFWVADQYRSTNWLWVLRSVDDGIHNSVHVSIKHLLTWTRCTCDFHRWHQMRRRSFTPSYFVDLSFLSGLWWPQASNLNEQIMNASLIASAQTTQTCS